MQKHKHEVIIVGSWWAGLRCAIQLREQWQRNILIVWDRKFTDAHTIRARWWINAALGTLDSKDTPLSHAVDTYREAQFVANPHLVETLAHNAPSAINDLVAWWWNFHREDDGRLTQRFFGAHSYRRTCFSGDKTGQEMIRVLTHKANQLGIPYLEYTYVYKLVVENERVQWVLCVKDNDIIALETPTVVFATWWFPNVYARSSSRNRENFGDGIGIAFKEWARIWDLELIQFHPTGLLYPEEHSWELVTEAMRWEWAILTNSLGERFMNKYDPLKMELSTRDVVARANFREIKEGRGTPNWWVRLDISHRELSYIKERLPKMHSMILEYNNVDISQAPVEVAPTTHYTMGWIWFDHTTLQTTIEWFYVAGECTMWVHGANRLWWNSLMETMVFGKLVANEILWRKAVKTSINHNYLDEFHFSDSWENYRAHLEEIRHAMRENAGILRKADELTNLEWLLEEKHKTIQELLLARENNLQESLIAHNRLHIVITLAKLITHGALERKESRWAHFRVDFPEMDNTFNKNYYHTMVNWKIESHWEASLLPSAELQNGLDTTERTKNYQHLE